jgi:hypothetical protein
MGDRVVGGRGLRHRIHVEFRSQTNDELAILAQGAGPVPRAMAKRHRAPDRIFAPRVDAKQLLRECESTFGLRRLVSADQLEQRALDERLQAFALRVEPIVFDAVEKRCAVECHRGFERRVVRGEALEIAEVDRRRGRRIPRDRFLVGEQPRRAGRGWQRLRQIVQVSA